MTTGMGHANAAASTMALALSPQFDLSHTYFVVTGIAGIDPNVGTLGAAAWARYLVDFGLQQEFDAARGAAAVAKAATWASAPPTPPTKPKLEYGTEVFQLDEALLQRALALSRGRDAWRTTTPPPPTASSIRRRPRRRRRASCSATRSPATPGGTARGWASARPAWTRLLTDGKGTYCTTQQEDNATYEALRRGAAAGRLDLHRVAVLRTGANFDRPHPGQTAQESLERAVRRLPDRHGQPLSGGLAAGVGHRGALAAVARGRAGALSAPSRGHASGRRTRRCARRLRACAPGGRSARRGTRSGRGHRSVSRARSHTSVGAGQGAGGTPCCRHCVSSPIARIDMTIM